MKNKLRKNYKFILGMIFGIVISASSVYAATVLTSKEVSYDNTNSKLSSTNVKDAIDEVNEKATTKLEEAEKSCPDGYECNKIPLLKYFAFIRGDFTAEQIKSENITDFSSITKHSFAMFDEDGKINGVCINDGNLFCLKTSDYDNSVSKLKEHFGESSCSISENRFTCDSNQDFYCDAWDGGVECSEMVTYSRCTAYDSGSFNCDGAYD